MSTQPIVRAVTRLAPLILCGAVLAGAWGVVHAGSSALAPTAAFQFQQGSGYGSASDLATANFPSGGSSGPTVTVALHGISGVLVSAFDVVEFAVANPPSRDASLSDLTATVPPGSPDGVVCAFAFLSTAMPDAGTATVPGAPTGCDATMPKLGGMAPGCSGASPATAVVDLLTGNVSGVTAVGCNIPAGSVQGTAVLYLSYEFVTVAAPSSGAVSSVTLSVTA